MKRKAYSDDNSSYNASRCFVTTVRDEVEGDCRQKRFRSKNFPHCSKRIRESRKTTGKKQKKLTTGNKFTWNGILFYDYAEPESVHTYLANCVTKETIKSTYFLISCYDFVSIWLLEIESFVKTKFDLFHQHHSQPMVIFIKKMNTQFTTNSQNEIGSKVSIKTNFLIQMCRQDLNSVLVLGTTKIPCAMVSAIRGHFKKRNFIVKYNDREKRVRLTICKVFLNNSTQTLINENFNEFPKSARAYSEIDFTIVAQKAHLKHFRKKYTFLYVPTFLSKATEFEEKATNEHKSGAYRQASESYLCSLKHYVDVSSYERNGLDLTWKCCKIFDKMTSLRRRIVELDNILAKQMKQRCGPRISFKGTIIYGGSKTVKTYLAKVIASETIKSTYFLVLATNEFVMKWFKDIEKLVKTKYNRTHHRECQPMVIFINEIDTLFTTPINEFESKSCIKTEFLLRMLGSDPVLVLGSTNISWALLSAIHRKFKKHVFQPSDVFVDDSPLAICKIHLNNSSHTVANQNLRKLKVTTETSEANPAIDFSVVVQKSHLKDLRNEYTSLAVPTFFLAALKFEAKASLEEKCRRYDNARRLYSRSFRSYMDCNLYENENGIYGTDFCNEKIKQHFNRSNDLWEKISIRRKITKQSTGKRIPFRGVLFFGRLRIVRAYLTNVIASETIKSTYFVVSSYDFVSKWLYEVEKQVDAKYRIAHHRYDKPLILLIDEIDTDSNDGCEFECCVQTEFLIQMAVNNWTTVLVIGATNISMAMASAIRQQFGKRNFLAPEVPDKGTRLAKLKFNFDNSSYTLLSENLKTVLKTTKDYSANDIFVLVQKLPNE